MAEPRICFFNPAAPPTMTLLNNVQFIAVGGGAIKAGDFSATRQVAIWNDPYTSNTTGPTPVLDPLTPPSGGYSPGVSDGVVAATNVDITTRNTDGLATLDVVTGLWMNVQFPGGDGADAEANDPAGKFVGFSGSNTVVAVLGTLNPNAYKLVNFKLKPPGNASAGNRDFVIRVSYSFT